MKSSNKKNKEGLLERLDSVRIKLFATLCIIVVLIILFLVGVNSTVLESYYIYSKQKELMAVYEAINSYYNGTNNSPNIEITLEKLALSNSFDILIKTDNQIYASSRDFLSSLTDELDINNRKNENILYDNDNVTIKRTIDKKTELSFILLSATLDNGYELHIRVAIISIQESVKIANKFLMLIGCFTIVISGILVSLVSRKFTSPIEELNKITKKISNLDFSLKYRVNDSNDEINNLGKNINAMSETLEKIINQLRNSNIELEKDIEEKSRTDEMRKQFISDVSHELKTPISLIQGYAEGLIENVAKDEESKKFYAEVIL
ncbi:MAG: HAMP domain-containing protein, partial [Clostridia bacterium]|nr:HAMP domain-containing protein [Clostridia bacterium]